jgi:hypothetical protein
MAASAANTFIEPREVIAALKERLEALAAIRSQIDVLLAKLRESSLLG